MTSHLVVKLLYIVHNYCISVIRTTALRNRLKELNLAHLAKGQPEHDELLMHIADATADIGRGTHDDLRKRVLLLQLHKLEPSHSIPWLTVH